MTRSANFDSVAWFYDPLTQLVFGNRLKKSQIRFLATIPPGSTVLILGGGTGWILDELFAHTPDCRVYYVESSRAMLERARAHGKGFKVAFKSGSWEQLPDIDFDAVITHYFLDLFSDRTLEQVSAAVNARLKQDGTWLVTDFVCSTTWHRVMLWVMYRFFRVTCGIDALQLPDWEGRLGRLGYVPKEYEYFYGGFMKSMRFARGNAR